jgi:hypothetical protein
MKKLIGAFSSLRSVLHASCSLGLGMSCLGLATSASAGPITVFTSDFDNNTGQRVIAGDADNTSGSAQVNDISWTQAPGISVSPNLNLRQLTGEGGFTQVQNGLNALFTVSCSFPIA